MQVWLAQTYYRYQAGLKKRSIPVDDHGAARFSYCEKGSRISGRPSIIFVHGLSSNKETWIPIVKAIPNIYHVITLDLPGHGETIGLNEDIYTIEKFADKLKLFFDIMDLTEPMCIVGASMGGAVVSMFAVRYPEYVSMICLLAPVANEDAETEIIQKLKTGDSGALLPETPQQLRHMINKLTVKGVKLPRPFLNGFLHLRLRLLEEHKKILSSLLKHDYPQFHVHYQKLRNLDRPALILWGCQDQVYTPVGAQYFCNILPKVECVLLDDCGHLMAIDKPAETATHIINFLESYADSTEKLLLTTAI